MALQTPDADGRAIRRRLFALYSAGSGQRVYCALRWAMNPFERLSAALPTEGRIVELGAGPGVLSNYLALASPARSVVAVDLDRSKQFRGQAPANARFVRADAADFLRAERNASLAGIVMSDFLHHVPSERHGEILSLAARKLAADSVLLVLDVDRAQRVRLLLGDIVELLLYGQRHRYARSAAEWRAILVSSGFASVGVEYPTRGPFSACLLRARPNLSGSTISSACSGCPPAPPNSSTTSSGFGPT